ncbi:MAG: zinc-ribbon domain-containing protein [Candidatus Heimdallarchaeota archaeon]|nr:zinc-ribbon domain-containing protein [Candidatus Heimdallarchaeota archaeon]
MSAIFCSNCGEKHTTSSKFCENCGTDLGEAILRHKQKHLPIKYVQSLPPKPDSQESINEKRKIPKQKVSTIAFILSIIFLIVAIFLLFIANRMDINESWIFILAAVFGSLFLISLIIHSAFNPKRSGICSGCSGCSGTECSGCGGCDCGGFDC